MDIETFKTHSHSAPPIADLHCDLLWYLSLNSQRTPHNREVRCSIPQLNEGRVKIQTMAIFTQTDENSVISGLKQADIFKDLPKHHPNTFQFLHQFDDLDNLQTSHKIGIIPAIENASAICTEKEDLESALERLTAIQKKIGKLFYLSLTWNTENRFGGGNYTKVGLKEDGKRLVDYLFSNGIALDFSHASDYLADDLLNYLDKNGLTIPVLASHSNMRSITNVPRNLPDDIVKEIVKREGLIGLNFIRSFLGGESPRIFSKHLAHLLKLGAEENACFGADFFCVEDLPLESRSSQGDLFFDSCAHAGTYGKVIEVWHQELNLSNSIFNNICFDNFVKFYKKINFK